MTKHLPVPPPVETLALWLFDDPAYPGASLLDASPHQIDLRLGAGASIVSGRTGGGVQLTADKKGPALTLACPPDDLYRLPAPDRLAGRPGPEMLNLGYFDWVVEFWLQPTGEQAGWGTLFEIRARSTDLVPVASNALLIAPQRTRWVLRLGFTGHELDVPTDESALADGGWHHIAFQYVADQQQLHHFVDGVLQATPDRGGFIPTLGLFDFTIGRALDESDAFVGVIDEFRISRGRRYMAAFAPPATLAREPAAPQMGAPTRAAIGTDPDAAPVALGKHVFIDGALLEDSDNATFTLNPPRVDVLDFAIDRPWEASPRFGPAQPDFLNVYDAGDEFRLVYTNGGMWGGWRSTLSMATSADGVTWSKPELGMVCWDGSRANNILIADAVQGTMFLDPNPDAVAAERYKFLAYAMQRGIVGYTSPDGLHWRRNETVALPFDCGGGVEAYWDDQRQTYVTYIRHEGFVFEGSGDRAAARAESASFHGPWHFRAPDEPRTREGVFSLPTTTSELPVPFPPSELGGVYRTNAIKYPWAADTYVAFPWRYQMADNIRPGSELAVSRDGDAWRFFGRPFYLGPTWEIEGREVVESLVIHGLVRRDDAIWHYATARFTAHAGAAFGGRELDGGIHDRLLRLVQRLDGFVALEPNGQGPYTTRALILEGHDLTLNANARGTIRVELLDIDGTPIEGFSYDEAIPITGDSLAHRVAWAGEPSLAAVVGRPLRLGISLDDARVFAIHAAS